MDEGKYQHQYKKGQSKNNVFTGNRGSTHQCTSKADVKFNVKSVQSLLEKKHMPYLPPCVTKIATNLERSLADHTEVDNMDEDNKFICNECMKNKGTVLYIQKFSRDETFMNFASVDNFVKIISLKMIFEMLEVMYTAITFIVQMFSRSSSIKKYKNIILHAFAKVLSLEEFQPYGMFLVYILLKIVIWYCINQSVCTASKKD